MFSCPDCKGTKRIMLLTGYVPCERCAAAVASELDRDLMPPRREWNQEIDLTAITDSSGGVIGYTMTGQPHDLSD